MAYTDVCAIVSVRNEAHAVSNVLRQLYRAGVKQCIVIANGCSDETSLVAKHLVKRLFTQSVVLDVLEPLGPDVPKAVGTYAALRRMHGAAWMLYVDGDWRGSFGPMLEAFLEAGCTEKTDIQWIALRDDGTNPQECVLRRNERHDLHLWQSVIAPRHPALKIAAIAQSPVLVHRRVFRRISPYWLYQPGLWFARTILMNNPRVVQRVFLDWHHPGIGNPTRSEEHAEKMVETLIGDALEGCRLLLGQKSSRMWRGKYYDGYHSSRRTDVLTVTAQSFDMPPTGENAR